MDSWASIFSVTMQQSVAKNGERDTDLYVRDIALHYCYSLSLFPCIPFTGIPIAQIAQIMGTPSTQKTRTNLGAINQPQLATTSSLTSAEVVARMGVTIQHGWVIFPLKNTTSFDEEWNAVPSTFQRRPTVHMKIPLRLRLVITGLATKTIPLIPPQRPSSTTTHSIQTSLPMPV